MPKRTLSCYKLMYQGRPYRLHGQTITVHAFSGSAAMVLLKAVSHTLGLSVFRKLYFMHNDKCDPNTLQPGDHCYHHLVAKTSSDDTPLGSIEPNSPEWERRIRPDPAPQTDRERLIERVRQRKDIGDPD